MWFFSLLCFKIIFILKVYLYTQPTFCAPYDLISNQAVPLCICLRPTPDIFFCKNAPVSSHHMFSAIQGHCLSKAVLDSPSVLPVSQQHLLAKVGGSDFLRVCPSESKRFTVASDCRVHDLFVFSGSVQRELTGSCRGKLPASPWGFWANRHRITLQNKHTSNSSSQPHLEAQALPDVTMCTNCPESKAHWTQWNFRVDIYGVIETVALMEVPSSSTGKGIEAPGGYFWATPASNPLCRPKNASWMQQEVNWK